MSISKLKIISVLSKSKQKDCEEMAKWWEKYFSYTHDIIKPSDSESLSKKNIDILFVDIKGFEKISNEMIRKLKGLNPNFSFVLIRDKPNDDDEYYLKNYIDNIIYLKNKETAKWMSIAILRRYWDTYSKPTTLFYKNIIADFIENKVSINGKETELTSKEIKLLWHFMNNVNKYIPKKYLFEKVWGIKDEDSTRVLNQMIFKLKNKIGKEYFTSKKLEGIMFK